MDDPFKGAKSARDAAMEDADRAANPIWKAWMYERIVEVARVSPTFTTDDIERLRIERQGPRTHEKRALGPLMRSAQKAGICTPTPTFANSKQRSNHARPVRVWASAICETSSAIAA